MSDPGALPIPPSFLEEVDRLHGAPGYAWLATVSDLLLQVTKAWSVTVEGNAMHGAHGLVIPVRRNDGIPFALKIAPPDEATEREIAGLRAWNGHGCVQLIAADVAAGALMMERLDASRDLMSLPIDAATQHVGRLARHLAVPTSDPVSFPTTSDRAREIEANLPTSWERAAQPFPESRIQRVVDRTRTLADRNDRRMATWDLHSENVLWGERAGWTMIDPVPMIGDPDIALAPFLWTRTEEIHGPDHLQKLVDAFVASGSLDASCTRDWLMVRLVDYWLWGLNIGLTIDPERCRTLLDWLDPLPTERLR